MSSFPSMPYTDWVDTRDSLHLFLQIIGKVFRSQTAAMQSRVRLHQGVPARIWNDRAPGR